MLSSSDIPASLAGLTLLATIFTALPVVAMASTPSLGRSPAQLESAVLVKDNPLFEAWTTPLATQTEAPTFANTIDAFELADADLQRVQRVLNVYTASATSDEFRAIQRDMSPRLAAHESAIMLDEQLFARIADLHDRRDDLDLTAEQTRVLERKYTRFVRAGAKLTGKDRDGLAAINAELATLRTTFSQNVQKHAESCVK